MMLAEDVIAGDEGDKFELPNEHVLVVRDRFFDAKEGQPFTVEKVVCRDVPTGTYYLVMVNYDFDTPAFRQYVELRPEEFADGMRDDRYLPFCGNGPLIEK